jgi:hypothetical protein
MIRQAFKLAESQRVWGSLGEEGVSAFHAQPYIRHITRQPGHADRDCVVHVHETTAAGPILVDIRFEKLTPLKQKMSEWLCTRRIRCLASVPAPIRQPRLQLVIPSCLSRVFSVGILRLLRGTTKNKERSADAVLSIAMADVASAVADRREIADMAQPHG